MEAALIARPSEDKIFTAVRGQGAYVQSGRRRPRRLRLNKTPRTNKAFISSKARPFQAPARPQLEPREYPIGAALVLTLSGLHRAGVRDVWGGMTRMLRHGPTVGTSVAS